MERKYQLLIDRAAEIGYQNEMKYWGCSQAVVSALIEAFGIGGSNILRAATALAGGVARRGNVCGALLGGLIMVGLLVGRDDLEMMEQYQRGMDFGDKLYRRFEEKLGSALCAEIQKVKFGRTFDMVTQEGREVFYEAGAHSPEGCPTVTREGARLAAEIIVEILKQGRPLTRILTRET